MDFSDEALKRLLDSGHAKGIEAPLIHELRQTRLQISELKKAIGFHSCPPAGEFCWRCTAMEEIEKALTQKRNHERSPE